MSMAFMSPIAAIAPSSDTTSAITTIAVVFRSMLTAHKAVMVLAAIRRFMEISCMKTVLPVEQLSTSTVYRVHLSTTIFFTTTTHRALHFSDRMDQHHPPMPPSCTIQLSTLQMHDGAFWPSMVHPGHRCTITS